LFEKGLAVLPRKQYIGFPEGNFLAGDPLDEFGEVVVYGKVSGAV
jgi:hypothetical protein